MFCKRGIYVNWGNIPEMEMDFGPINLFSGGNGSGKTTAADGIQSLMTAAYESLFHYNPGQDETTQRGRGGKQVRSLASYVLGCDDGSYARLRPTDGYVAGVFHPTTGESGDIFTAVMCVRARLDAAGAQRQAREEDILFFIIPHEELKLGHFVREDKGGKYVVPLDEIAKLFKKEFGAKNVEEYDKKSAYLRRLYGALKGSKNPVGDREAKHAAKTFSSFMAYKPVKSITEFVAREILEPRDLHDDIHQVSELMKTIHGMEADTRQLKASIGNIEQAQQLSADYIQHWIAACVGEYSEASRLLQVKQHDYLKAKQEQRNNSESINETKALLQDTDNRRELAHEQIVSLEAQRQGIAALKTKDDLEREIVQCGKSLTEKAAPLLQQDKQFGINHQAASQLTKKLGEYSLGIDIKELESSDFRQTAKALIEAGENSGINMQQLLTRDWVDISALENRLDGVLQLEIQHRRFADYLHNAELASDGISIRDKINQVFTRKSDQRQRAEKSLYQKEQDIKKLENHKVIYPAYVEAAIAAIETACPQAKPCVLCDYIEVLDPEWQMAIEGYIGNTRFSIVVEPAFEAEAIQIVRNMPGNKRNNARIIQGAKAQRDAARLTIGKDSILEVMRFNHKIVEAYLAASYGNVVRVENARLLANTARGITADGMGSGGYSLFRCDMNDGDLVFGQGARQRALQAKRKEYEDLLQQSDRLESDYQSLARIQEMVEKIRPVNCTEVIKSMLAVYRQLEKAENQLKNLDLSDFAELENKLLDLKKTYGDIVEEGKNLNQTLGGLEKETRQIEQKINNLANEKDILQEQQEQQEKAVIHIANVYPDFDSESALSAAEDKAGKARQNFSFSEENRDLLTRMEKCERTLYETVMNHNQMCNSYDAIAYHMGTGNRHDADYFKQMTRLATDLNLVYNRLKNNVLVEKFEQLSALKESFNTAFVTNLCHSIYQSIQQGKSVLDDLNKELEHHRFGADRERFYFDYEWVPEYKEYWQFFKDVIDIPNLGDGSTLFDADLSEKSKMVRDKLMAMLLDKDEQTALRELVRLSDYRNYRRYEIYKEPLNKAPIALSQYGTGSGGQLETPAYIIRSAAVTSAFRFNEGNTHCRMVLVDEAFSKMDETRSREVINYLTETLGLQLIFIMPTSKSGPFMDLISNQIVFSKCPTTEKIGELNTRVLVDRKVCNQEKIAQLWANHRKTVRHQAMLDFMDGV